jgi:hypothetical protein
MIRNFKIYENLMEIYNKQLDNRPMISNKSHINEVRKKVARLLNYFVKGNEINQKIMI